MQFYLDVFKMESRECFFRLPGFYITVVITNFHVNYFALKDQDS
ncbi:hypothetical protein ME9_00075 [Bartonella taylorii 8TBB]|uniref:Uncharacterized protein n=1 Tax=Bartonella taylorii 8TBB TaxID=1094560 RepID=A0A9P2S1L0_BARTA|nr:hypothetical protein ME9_00075 [Bartonella taylorii 8TBB]OPB34947.1 hypothetical protein Btaycd_010060 [Bartonella taylorii]